MASFIMAMNIVAGARKAHADLSHQIDLSLDVFGENKAKNLKVFATMGRYDILAMFDAEDQYVAFKIASQINARGVLETETWPVIPYDEYQQLTER